MALHQRNRGAAVFQDHLDGLVVERIALGLAAPLTGLAAFLIIAGRAIEDVRNVFRCAARLQLLDDAMHLVIRHEGAMHARRITGARRQVEHVAHAE